MDSSEYWQMLFESWPPSFPPRGLIVTSFQETIPFVNFMIRDGMIVLERDKPDSYDARKVVLPFGSIAALKFTATFDLDQFKGLGFRPPKQ